MLDVFIDNIGESYSKKEVQDLAGISKGALFHNPNRNGSGVHPNKKFGLQHWHKLEELRLVKLQNQQDSANCKILLDFATVTRTFGKTRLYTLDRSNPLVKDILKFESRMIEETAPREIAAVVC